jgi:hypothetical protein
MKSNLPESLISLSFVNCGQATQAILRPVGISRRLEIIDEQFGTKRMHAL